MHFQHVFISNRQASVKERSYKHIKNVLVLARRSRLPPHALPHRVNAQTVWMHLCIRLSYVYCSATSSAMSCTGQGTGRPACTLQATRVPSCKPRHSPCLSSARTRLNPRACDVFDNVCTCSRLIQFEALRPAPAHWRLLHQRLSRGQLSSFIQII